MGLTALRNKRGIRANPGGKPDPATLKPSAGGTQRQPVQQQAGDGQGAAAGGPSGVMAPRYQKLLAEGVDPQVVMNRAKAYQAGQLPGQQQPGTLPSSGGMGMGQPLSGGDRMPGGGFSPAQLATLSRNAVGGSSPAQPGFGAPLPAAAPGQSGPLSKPVIRPIPGVNPGGLVKPGQPNPFFQPTQEPTGVPLGGALSPNAWGSLGATLNAANATRGGGAPLGLHPMIPNEPAVLPNGQPMGGGAPTPFTPPVDSYTPPAPLQSTNGGTGIQGRPDLQSMSDAPVPQGGVGGTPAPPVPDMQARQAAIARGLAGRMVGGGAFNQ